MDEAEVRTGTGEEESKNMVKGGGGAEGGGVWGGGGLNHGALRVRLNLDTNGEGVDSTKAFSFAI